MDIDIEQMLHEKLGLAYYVLKDEPCDTRLFRVAEKLSESKILDLKDQQAERQRVVGEIEKLLNKIIWFSDNTPCISEEKERGCFRCTAEEIELWWQSLKNKILGGING